MTIPIKAVVEMLLQDPNLTWTPTCVVDTRNGPRNFSQASMSPEIASAFFRLYLKRKPELKKAGIFIAKDPGVKEPGEPDGYILQYWTKPNPKDPETYLANWTV